MGVEIQILGFHYLFYVFQAAAWYNPITITHIGSKIDTIKGSVKNLIPQSLGLPQWLKEAIR